MKTPLLDQDYNAQLNSSNQEAHKVQSNEKNLFLEVCGQVHEPAIYDLNNNSSNNANIFLSSQQTLINDATSSPLSCYSKQNADGTNSFNRKLFDKTVVNFSPQSTKSNNTNNTIVSGGLLNSAILCRICYTADREPLMQPCNCSGTMGLMHRTCLEKWLSQSNSHKCEICNFEFLVDKQARSFSQWLFRPLTFKDNKNLFNDLICFMILTPLAFISTWYCVLFALKFHEAENRWEASGLVVLTTFLLFIYILWFIFSCKYHRRVFKDWQKKNQIITLKLSEEKASSKVFNALNGMERMGQNSGNKINDLSLNMVTNNIELLTRSPEPKNFAVGYNPQLQLQPLCENSICSVIMLETNINGEYGQAANVRESDKENVNKAVNV